MVHFPVFVILAQKRPYVNKTSFHFAVLISLASQNPKCLRNFKNFDFQVSFSGSFSYASDVFYSKII